MTDPSDEPLARVAASERLLVALDFDGTLAPLEDEPMDARMLPAARDAVERPARRPAHRRWPSCRVAASAICARSPSTATTRACCWPAPMARSSGCPARAPSRTTTIPPTRRCATGCARDAEAATRHLDGRVDRAQDVRARRAHAPGDAGSRRQRPIAWSMRSCRPRRRTGAAGPATTSSSTRSAMRARTPRSPSCASAPARPRCCSRATT